VISPNGDGADDSATISYALSAAATVTATLVDPSEATLATLFSEWRPAGRHAFAFTADTVTDGLYTIVLTAAGADGKVVTGRVDLMVDRGTGGGL
jgi:uncharacterized membrane protein